MPTDSETLVQTDTRKLIATNAAVVAGQVLYTLSPIDIIPDIIPVLGQLDDLGALLFTIAFTVYTVMQIRELKKKGKLPTAEPNVRETPLDDRHIDLAYSKKSDAWEGYEPLSTAEIAAL